MVYAMHKDMLSSTLALIELLKRQGQFSYIAEEGVSYDSCVTLLGTNLYLKSGKPMRVESADIDVELMWLSAIDADMDDAKEYGKANFLKGDLNDLMDLSGNIHKFLGTPAEQMSYAA